MLPLVSNRRSQLRRSEHPTVIGLLLAVLLLMIPWMSAPPAAAHAGFADSDPEPNAVVAAPPAAVTIRFTEPLERSYSTAELYDQQGEVVSGTSVEAGANEYELRLLLPKDLPNGTYSVLWRTLSTADGHTAQNYFAFTIGSEDDVAAVDGPDADAEPLDTPLWLRTVARWTAYLGLAAAVAAWPVWLLVVRPAAKPVRSEARRLVRRSQVFAWAAILFALLGNVLSIGVQAAGLPDGSLIDRIRSTLGETRYGELWYMRVALLGAYAIVLQWVPWWWPKRRLALTLGALVLAMVLVVPFSYIAHASAQTTGRSAAILNDILHLLAASIWAGGLLVIVVVLLPSLRGRRDEAARLALSRALARFSTLALMAWTTLALTGVYSAWLHVGSIDALLDTDYGNALLGKLLLLIPILALAAFNLFVVTSRLERLAGNPDRIMTWIRRFLIAVSAEIALAVAVMLVVGTLTAQAPARESLGTETREEVRVELTGGERGATLTIDPGTPGPNRFRIDIDGEPLSHDAAVLLRLSSSDQDTGEKEIAFAHGDANVYTYEGSELSLAGDWDFELIVRPPDAFEWRGYGNVAIGPVDVTPAQSTPSWVLSSRGGTSGLLLLVFGVVVVLTAWRTARPRYRMPLLAAGVAALAIGMVISALTRTELPGIVATVFARFG